MKNEVDLRFCIWDFDDVTPEEITGILGVEPFRIYKKGERRNPKFPALSKRNGWIMKPLCDQYASFEEQMGAMLDILESKIDLFKPLCGRYFCEFSCAIIIRFDNDESTPWVHLNSRYNKLIQQLNIEFDIDLYCLPNRD